MQPTNSRKRMLALALTAGVLIATFSASHPTVSAADLALPQGGILDVLERQKAAIVGAWDAPDSTGFQALLTFHADGTLSASDEDPTATNGHGVWRHLGGTQFAFTYVQHKKAGQQQQGTATIWGRINMESSGRQFSGTLHFEFADTEGNVVDSDALQGLNLALTGKRIQIRL